MDDSSGILELDGQEAGLIDLAAYHRALHTKWQPHAGQIPLGWALFYGGFKDIFACCGRNFGKTEITAYCSDRYANENKGSENYIFGPIQKQIKEILWASGRIQGLGPEEYKQGVNNVEMRVLYKNGSFIKLDGSDNVDAYRGIKPRGLSVYDEFKDMRPDFIDAYDPNRAAFDSPAIYIGTPPEFHNHFVDTMRKAQRYHMESWFYLHAPSRVNPHLSQRFLINKEKELREAGESEKWLREYEAMFVLGGKRSIFPQFLKLKHLPYDVPKDLNKHHLIVTFDPAASSVFGVLFALYNPFTKKIIVFDEIYETNPSEMTALKMFQKVEDKLAFYQGKVKEIRFCYDEAARYFRSEIYEIPKEVWIDGKKYKNTWDLEPSRKHDVGVHGYISIVRSVLNKAIVEVSENCTKFIWEMQNYIKDEDGKIPKVNDHLINAFQYKLQALGFNLEEDLEPKPDDPFLARRGLSMESEILGTNNLVDFDHDFANHQSLRDIDE